ncbi:MAG: glycohydrolase toxin TNT-related protein [Glaciihabitans sp.]
MSGLLDPLAEYELIVPGNIPGTTIDSAQISEAATSFSTMAATTREKGSAIKTTWSGLSAHYEAPESADLLAVMDPVESNSTIIADKFDRISTLLTTLSDTVGPIKTRLAELKVEAEAFVADVQNGVLVSEKAAEQAGTGSGVYGTNSSYSGGTYISGTYVGGSSSATTTKTVAWHEDLATNTRNRNLIRDVNEQVAKLDAAQADCVNGLRLLSTDPWKVPEAYVPMTEDALNQAGVELPWGAATRDIPCESSFGYGVASGLAGMYQGAGALVSFNAETGQWGDGELFGQSWRGLGMTGAGVVLAANPATWVERLIPGDNRPQWMQDFENEALDTALGAGKSLVAWDMWGEDPAQAAGLVGVNAATFFIPGGAVVGSLKAGTVGARAASFLGHAADVIIPGGRLLTNTATTGLLHAGQGVRVLTDTARTGLTSGISTARGMLAQSLHDVANQLPTVDVVPGASAVTPDGLMTNPTLPRVEVGAPGSGGDWLHSVAERVDGGTAPDAGSAVGADSATTHGGSSPQDGSVATESPSGQNGTSDPNGTPSNTSTAGQQPLGPVADSIAHGTDPTSTTAASGPDWNRHADVPAQNDPAITPGDADYGQPQANHGSTIVPGSNGVPVNPDSVALVRDPSLPFGRDEAGNPLDKAGYDERYTKSPAGNAAFSADRYPPNAGAVPGSVVHYDNVAGVVRDYGGQLDRIGPDNGGYLGVQVDGKPAFFEERALPVRMLKEDYSQYTLDPNADIGNYKIEVSRIAPGFGHDGGGVQLRVLELVKGKFVEVPVSRLIGEDILIEVPKVAP